MDLLSALGGFSSLILAIAQTIFSIYLQADFKVTLVESTFRKRIGNLTLDFQNQLKRPLEQKFVT
jgi:hypothetical protein